jgi:DNA uptake protein ComE-like DNA-binding protein
MVGPEQGRRLIEQRPFESWDDVTRVPGFELGIIDDLRSGGAQIGGKHD